MTTVDLSVTGVRELNRLLHHLPHETNERVWTIANPRGAHAIAVGLTQDVDVSISGHVGYYCGAMNQNATVTIEGHCGTGVAENIMSGLVRVKGNASQCAGASGHGGTLVIEGDAGPRCGISMKGVNIVVGGNAGHMSAFMAQTGNLVICGDAGPDLGDSIYETVIYVGGAPASLGADCIEKDMTPGHQDRLGRLLRDSGLDADPGRFRRFGSARKLYNFRVDNAGAY